MEQTTTRSTRDDSSIWRRLAIFLLVVVGALAIALGNLYAWVVTTTLTTDKWVAATAPLAHDPAVQTAVGTLVLQKVDAAVDIEALIAERLPDPLDPLAPLVAGQVRQFVSNAVFEFVASDGFADAWETAMRDGHAAVLGLVRETEIDPTIPLKIDSIAQQLDQRLQARGIDLFPDGGPPSLGDIAIRLDDRLTQVQNLITWAERLVLIVPLVALLAFVGALALARRRGRLFIEIAATVALVLVVELALFRVVATEIASTPRQPVYQAGLEAMLDILLAGLFDQTRALIIAAALIAVAAFVVRMSARLEPVRAFIVRWGRLLQLITALVAGAYLLFGPGVTVNRFLLVGALAAAAVLGIESVMRGGDEGEATEPLTPATGT
jgi:hypothetical protein